MNKYRAWDKENKRMIFPSSLDVCFEMTDDGINILDCSSFPLDNVFPMLDAIPMQSTGLKDKNGVEIFEGDYVSYYGFIYTVIVKDSAFGWIEDDTFIPFAEMCIDEISKAYIVGNSHQNPELLK